MKKQINSSVKAYLIRGAFICFCFWPFARFRSRWRSETRSEAFLLSKANKQSVQSSPLRLAACPARWL